MAGAGIQEAAGQSREIALKLRQEYPAARQRVSTVEMRSIKCRSVLNRTALPADYAVKPARDVLTPAFTAAPGTWLNSLLSRVNGESL